MKTNTTDRIKIGFFVILGIFLLIAGIFLIGSKKNMFVRTYSVYGIFKNTGGLQAGNNVRFGGVNVGTVKAITILHDTMIRVDMIIQTDMSRFIKSDAVASVSSDGLMGDKLVAVAPGNANIPQLTPGSRIRTEEPVDYSAIIGKFSTVADNATVITGALAHMALEIKNGNGSINRLLYHDDLAVALEGTLNNTRTITGSLQGVATQITSGHGSIGSLIYTDTLAHQLDRTVSSANYALLTVQKAADNFSEDMRALQGNFLFRSYFKKKAAKLKEEGVDDSDADIELKDAELQQIRDEADKELQKRKIKESGNGANGSPNAR